MDKPANCGPHFSKSRPALNWTTLRVLNDPDLIKTGVMDIPVVRNKIFFFKPELACFTHAKDGVGGV